MSSAGRVQLFVSDLLKQTSSSSFDASYARALEDLITNSATIQLDPKITLTGVEAASFLRDFTAQTSFNSPLSTVLQHLWSLYTPTSATETLSKIDRLLRLVVVNQDCLFVLQFLVVDVLKASTLRLKFSIQCDLVESLLVEEFLESRRATRELLSLTSDEVVEDATCLLLGIPTLLANARQGSARPRLAHREFACTLIADWTAQLTNQKTGQLNSKTLAYFFGRLCFAGYAEAVWEYLLPVLVNSPPSRISAVMREIPSNYLDATLHPLFLTAPSPRLIHSTLTDLVHKNSRLMALLRKLLFLRHYSRCVFPRLLDNLFGYLELVGPPSQLPSLALALLQVWASATAIRATPYDQQFYVTAALGVCLTRLTTDELAAMELEAMGELLPGISAHLESPLLAVRLLGMVAGEFLTQLWMVAVESRQPLKFEYDETDDSRLLKSLWKGEISSSDFGGCTEPSVVKEEECEEAVAKAALDSDDDEDIFEPMLTGVPDDLVKRGKEPRYIRECLDGLLLSKPEEMDTWAECVCAAERLIFAHAASVSEVAIEFTRIVLHLTAQTTAPPLEDTFPCKRHRILVALCSVCPREVATHLCAEFYQPHYSLSQRLDMLQVLADTANRLSAPPTTLSSSATGAAPRAIEEVTDGGSSWRQIVAERLEKKTRRFGGSGREAAAKAVAAPNRFAAIAGHFFFDLMRPPLSAAVAATFDLSGRDYMVLSRLLYTLGVILHAARTVPLLPRMAAALLDYLWTVRGHPEPAVRRGVLFALLMTLLALPGHQLAATAPPEVISEWRHWIDSCRVVDTDSECRELATESCGLLAKRYREILTAPDY